MKKRLFLFISILLMFVGITSCSNEESNENFFDKHTLKTNLISDLPTPDAQATLLVNKNIVYVQSNETVEEYFTKVLIYMESLHFKYSGTIHNKKCDFSDENSADSYYFRSIYPFSSILPLNYFFKGENSYIFAYSNKNMKTNKNNESYFPNAHLLKVCCNSGTYEKASFDYDFSIKLINQPNLLADEPIDSSSKYKLTIVMDRLFLNQPIESECYLAPGSVITFYIFETYDVDYALCVDDTIYIQHTCIRYTDRYLWKYEFTMPDHDSKVELELTFSFF